MRIIFSDLKALSTLINPTSSSLHPFLIHRPFTKTLTLIPETLIQLRNQASMGGEIKPNNSKPKFIKDEPYLDSIIEKRVRLFESIKAHQNEALQRIAGETIRVLILPDGIVKEGKKWISSPMDIAKEISKSRAANALISQVNGTLWDMSRPLEGDCELKLFTFDTSEGRDTFWHSSAHILGQSLEMEYGCKLCIGPCTTRGEGFYYDAFYGDLALNEEHFDQIKSQATKAVANKEVAEAVQKVAAAYDCKIVEGVLSHQLKQFVIDGNKVILSVTNPETRVDDAEFEENEVYAIDIVTSTGDGKPKLLDEKQTTIYKRAVDKSYHLKMKSSRFIFSEINQKFPIMPFTARALEEKRARLGLVECVNHDLLQPYPVLHEKPGDLVAHIKFTVLLMPNGSDRITSHPLQELKPTKTIEDEPEIKAWLALATKTKKKGGGKKKKGKKGDAQGESAEAELMDSTTNGAAAQE